MTTRFPAPRAWTFGSFLLALLFACSGTGSPPRQTDAGGNGGALPNAGGFGGANSFSGTNAFGGTTPVPNGGTDPGGTDPGGTHGGMVGQQPDIDTCEGKRPPTNDPGQSCSEEGFACFHQIGLPVNVQNYFSSYTCCCGTWLIRSANSPSRAYSCAELGASSSSFPTRCGEAGAGGAGGEAGAGGAGGEPNSGGAAGAH